MLLLRRLLRGEGDEGFLVLPPGEPIKGAYDAEVVTRGHSDCCMTVIVGTLHEKALHAGLKAWYARGGGRVEVPVDGYVIDVVQGALLIEVQTSGFSAIKRKLTRLSESHSVLLVYPIPWERWLVPPDGPKRKSPRRGTPLDLFAELVSFPHLLARSTFSVEIAFTRENVHRHRDPRRGWRNHGWVVDERELLEVVDRRRFDHPQDFSTLLPTALSETFTTADLAHALGCRRSLAQKVTYCLRKMHMLEVVGRQQRAVLYARVDPLR